MADITGYWNQGENIKGRSINNNMYLQIIMNR